MMTKLQHPSFPDVTVDPPDADTDSWLTSGWIIAPEHDPGTMDPTGNGDN